LEDESPYNNITDTEERLLGNYEYDGEECDHMNDALKAIEI
jgi:hypothetical protein